MIFIDTHTHLYLKEFDNDRAQSVSRALAAGVETMLLPNIDLESANPLLDMCEAYPQNCLPMLGLHPTSVKGNYVEELEKLKQLKKAHNFYAIGETGMDLYWDVTFRKEQEEALRIQIMWAHEWGLPIVIHSRKALEEILNVICDSNLPRVKGVFHCYPGDATTALRIVDMGFLLGIGGVVTYPKTELPEVIRTVGLEHIILETDAPYLPPVPYRGKRNESAYIPVIAHAVARILNLTVEEVACITTRNAQKLFNLNY